MKKESGSGSDKRAAAQVANDGPDAQIICFEWSGAGSASGSYLFIT